MTEMETQTQSPQTVTDRRGQVRGEDKKHELGQRRGACGGQVARARAAA